MRRGCGGCLVLGELVHDRLSLARQVVEAGADALAERGGAAGVAVVVLGHELVQQPLHASFQPFRRGTLGPAPGDDRLAGGAQDNPGLLEFVLDLRADVHASGDAFDRLADHGCEPPVGLPRLAEQIRDAPVSRDGDGELFMRGTPAPRVGYGRGMLAELVKGKRDRR